MPSKRLPPAGGSLKWDPGKASRSRFMFDFLSHLRHEVLPGSLGPFRLPYPAQMVRNAGVGLVILQWHKRKRKKNCAENIQTKRYEGTCGKRYQPNAPTTRVSTIIFHSAVAALYPIARLFLVSTTELSLVRQQKAGCSSEITGIISRRKTRAQGHKG